MRADFPGVPCADTSEIADYTNSSRNDMMDEGKGASPEPRALRPTDGGIMSAGAHGRPRRMQRGVAELITLIEHDTLRSERGRRTRCSSTRLVSQAFA